jgi:prepilin-type N-terminal cleavage/methylation domain-containing protein
VTGVPIGRRVLGCGGNGGFTLIEIMVAVAVGGIVLLAGFSALNSVQDRSEHALQATEAARETASIRATLIDWLASAQVSSQELAVSFEGQDAAELDLPGDELTFPTTSRMALRKSLTSIRLYLDVDPLTPERGLVAEIVDRIGGEPGRMELVPDAAGFNVRYLPNVDGPVEWTESWVGQRQLPRAVEMIVLDTPDDPLPPLLRMPIRVALGYRP